MPSTSQPIRLSIVVPVYNERETLPQILAEVLRQGLACEIEFVIVDDGSTDGTRDWLQAFADGQLGTPLRIGLDADGALCRRDELAGDAAACWMQVHFQPHNQGKGAALRAGFGHCRFEAIVIQDADLEYDPCDLLPMHDLIERGIADVVYGSRFFGRPHRSLYLHHYMGNWLISRLVNVLCNATLSDVEVCYKMFRREVLQGMKLVCDDFGFEVEFTIKMLLSRRWRVYEMGIAYYGRGPYDEGKKINWKDGVKALWYIVRFRFSG